MFSDKKRIIIVVKAAGVYESLYIGHLRRFGSPSQYPYPLIAAGSSFGNIVTSDTSLQHQFFIGVERGASKWGAWVVDPGNTYKFPESIYFLPYHEFEVGEVAPEKTTNGKIVMTPVYIVNGQEGMTYGDFEGVYHIAVDTIQPEDRLLEGTLYYRVFPNVFRSAYYDYMAIKEA